MTVLEPVIQFLMDYKGKRVSLAQVISGADRPRRPVLRVMDRLVREGHLVEVEDTPEMRVYGEGGPDKRNPTWSILAKPLMKDFISRPKRITVRDRMWRLIRARRRFTRRELGRLSGATLGTCERFTQMLTRDGYLRILDGKDGHQHVYMLIKDPGPTRPATKEAKKNHAQ
jgi:DNA-binding IclR family transcriptional regulator